MITCKVMWLFANGVILLLKITTQIFTVYFKVKDDMKLYYKLHRRYSPDFHFLFWRKSLV